MCFLSISILDGFVNLFYHDSPLIDVTSLQCGQRPRPGLIAFFICSRHSTVFEKYSYVKPSIAIVSHSYSQLADNESNQ